MRRILLSLFALVLTLSALPAFADGVIGEAKYVCDIAVASNRNGGDPKQNLQRNGYEVVDNFDVNKGAGGDDIFIGVKYTSELTEAITDIVIMDGNYSSQASMNDVHISGRTWIRETILSEGNGWNGDLNRGAGGADLFLYYSKTGNTTESVISKLDINNSSGGQGVVYRFCGTTCKGVADLNKGAKGDYIYLHRTYVAGSPSISLCNSLLDINDFCNTFSITPDQPYITFFKRLNKSPISQMKVSIVYGSGTGEQKEIVLWEPSSYPYIETEESSKKGWITDQTLETTLFGKVVVKRGYCETVYSTQDGANTVWEEFRIYFSRIPYDANLKISETRDGVEHYVIRHINYDLNGVNEGEAIPNMQADVDNVGEMIAYFTTTFGVNSITVYDYNDYDFDNIAPKSSALALATNNVFDSEYVPTVTLPQTDTIRSCVAEMTTKVSASSDKENTNLTFTFPHLFDYKSVKSICNMTAEQVANQTDKDFRQSVNCITWQTARNGERDEDALDADEFMLVRSPKKDYSELYVAGSIDFTDTIKVEGDSLHNNYILYDGEVESLQGEAASDTLFYPMDHFTDDEAATLQYWTSLTHDGYQALAKDCNKVKGRKMYYALSRPILRGVWSTLPDKYLVKKEVLLRNSLPPVSSIEVEPKTDYESDQTVKVRVKLNNPYFAELLPESSGREKLMEEARQKGLNYRMYEWNDQADIILYRSGLKSNTGDQVADYAAKTITIKGTDVKTDSVNGYYYADIEDTHEYPFTRYNYGAKLDVTNCPYPLTSNDSATVQTSFYSDQAGLIKDFIASRGTESGFVKLSWEVSEGLLDSIRVERCTYLEGKGMDVEHSMVIATLSKTDTCFVDYEATPSMVFYYRIYGYCNWQGIDLSRATSWTPGYSSRYGKASGHVLMKDGCRFPGVSTVTIKSRNQINYRAVDIDEDNIHLAALEQKAGTEITVATDQMGNYEADLLIDPSMDLTSYYVSCPLFDPTTISIGLGQLAYSTDNDLIYNDIYRVSGRVLYQGSTVPVGGAKFKFNGNVLYDKQGNPVTSDTEGDFSFYVPGNMTASIQTFLEHHNMLNDGYLLSNIDGTSKEYVIRGDITEAQLQDATKVRLVGRLIGGNKQGKKAVGFGQTKNNLGDNLNMVLQLEGNNTAQIVYNNLNPDVTQRDTVFAQTLYKGSEELMNVDSTQVSYQRKRIVITPNVKTGEFCVDLFPTKYKVTQLSAMGYSTLYKEGEAFQIIDLTNDSILQTYTDNVLVGDSKNLTQEEVVATTKAHDVFSFIYHNPVNVTYTQLQYGALEQNFYGERQIKATNLLGVKSTMPLANYNKQNKTTTYTFGYPVFKDGNEYTFKVSAHEDYPYNNSISGDVEQVNIENGDLIVRSGLTSGVHELTDTLHSDGTQTFTITASNPNYTGTGEQALRSLNISVKVNGYYYDADPLRGFVLGDKVEGNTVVSGIDDNVDVLDIVRDPYGSKSYAWRESGTTYHWDRDDTSTQAESTTISGSLGVAATVNLGFMYLNQISGSVTGDFSVNAPATTTVTRTASDYTMTLNDRVQTSADPLDVGAMADVYIGKTTTMEVAKVRSVCVIDSTTYRLAQNSISKGLVKIVSSGKDAAGAPYYLAIGDKYAAGSKLSRTFIYTQKYILGTLIPDLEARRNELILEGTESQVQALANQTGTEQYWYDVDGDSIKMLKPAGMTDVCINRVDAYDNAIREWQQVIALNERDKVKAMLTGTKTALSLAGTNITHSENASSYYIYRYAQKKAKLTWSAGAGSSSTGSPKKPSKPTVKDVEIMHYGTNVDKNGVKSDVYQVTEQNEPGKTQRLEVGGVTFTIKVVHNTTPSVSSVKNYYQAQTAGSGYYLEANDNGYMDIDVYNIIEDKAYAVSADTTTAISDDNKFTVNGFLKAVHSGDTEAATIHDYVFVVRGGAARNPWYEPDSTMFLVGYTDQPYALGSQLLKIDNPKIYVDKPVVSNLPQDEKATFYVRLTNETEISDQSKYLNPSKFAVYLDDTSNPYGAKVYMDGVPLSGAKSIILDPGKSITKTVEVERGAAYDYNDLKLVFRDDACSLYDSTKISVHYLPTATTCKLTSPVSGWVMNTLSLKQDSAYYIPVTISGFDVNSDGFHHIEFQYKKSTDGEDQWTNICSYFYSDSLYAVATGNKKMIDAGTISTQFFGEKDPMEMKYDLRAVSFRSLGTGFVTYASPVISGTKDTRPPRVFGMPKPTSGILTYEDVISLPFNENIAYNYLDETSNFQVMGYTNESNYVGGMTLDFSGDAKEVATTVVKRNLANRDFTVDMLVQAKSRDAMTLLSHEGEDENGFIFYAQGGKLHVAMKSDNKVLFSSGRMIQPIDSALCRVGFIYSAKEQGVKFIYDNNIYEPESAEGIGDDVARTVAYNGNEYLRLGSSMYYADEYPSFKGSMADIRLWGKALNEAGLTDTNNRRLNGHEAGLMAYWPADEGQGTNLKDKANGADITLTSINWKNSDGYSLRLDSAAIVLKDAKKIRMNAEADYTVDFWFNTEKSTTGKATLLESGTADSRKQYREGLKLYFMSGKLRLSTADTTFTVGTMTLTDGTWHRLTVAVSHSNNIANVFVDGTLTNQESATLFGGLSDVNFTLGDAKLICNYDNICVWNLALPASYLSDFYNISPLGTELGLKVYLPFQTRKRNSQNVFYTAFTGDNQAQNRDAVDIAFNLNATSEQQDRTSHAPLLESDGITNLKFNWTCTDNELQINLDESDKKINHQNVILAVRNVEDLAGNPMESPQLWTIYVDKNVLAWDKQTVSANCHYGDEAEVSASWTNKGGKPMSYTITSDASWLTLSETMGYASPKEENSVDMTISDGLNPGTYTATVYLTDENNLTSELEVSATVTADGPGWSIDRTLYDCTMNVMAQVYQTYGETGESYIDAAKEDTVVAFCNGKVVGLANISNSKDLSYVYMNVLGNSANEGKQLTFCLWDASKGKVYHLASDTTVCFHSNTSVGMPPARPLKLRTSDYRIQEIAVQSGWNWVGLNVSPLVTTGVTGLFIDDAPFSKDDIIKDDSNHAEYDPEKGWQGDALAISNQKVYRIYMKHAGTLQVAGSKLSNAQRTFNLTTGWNQLPYPIESALSIERAMADYQIGDKAHEGDIITDLDQFAVLDSIFGWVGSLQTLRPGHGYYMHRSGGGCQLFFANTSEMNDDDAGIAPAKAKASAHTTTVIAAFAQGVEHTANDRLKAFVNGHEAGEAQLVTLPDGSERYFLNVNADEDANIVFAVESVSDDATGNESELRYAGRTSDNKATGIGTLKSPYELNFTDSEGLGDLYDLSGRKYVVKPLMRGVYITNGKKIIK